MLSQALCQSFSAHHQKIAPASSSPTLTQCIKQSIQKSTAQYWKYQKQTIWKNAAAISSAPTKIYQFVHRLVSVATSTKTSAVHIQAPTLHIKQVVPKLLLLLHTSSSIFQPWRLIIWPQKTHQKFHHKHAPALCLETCLWYLCITALLCTTKGTGK